MLWNLRVYERSVRSDRHGAGCFGGIDGSLGTGSRRVRNIAKHALIAEQSGDVLERRKHDAQIYVAWA